MGSMVHASLSDNAQTTRTLPYTMLRRAVHAQSCRAGTGSLRTLRASGRHIALLRQVPPQLCATQLRSLSSGPSTTLGASAASAGLSEAPVNPSGSAEITSQDLLERYRGLVASGRLQWDDEQVRTIMKVCRALASESLNPATGAADFSCVTY